jgi:hypothetical protein
LDSVLPLFSRLIGKWQISSSPMISEEKKKFISILQLQAAAL